jgi:isopenicillin-N epimerase
MERNRALARAGRDRLCRALGIAAPAPDSLLGSMVTLPLPDAADLALGDQLWTRDRIEVPVLHWPAAPRRWIRIATHLHNAIEQIEHLAARLCAPR